MATLVISYTILLLLILIVLFVYPSLYMVKHDQFEWTHCFLGWTATALVCSQVDIISLGVNCLLFLKLSSDNSTHKRLSKTWSNSWTGTNSLSGILASCNYDYFYPTSLDKIKESTRSGRSVIFACNQIIL